MGTPPIFLAGTPRNATGHGKGKREIHYLFLLSKVFTRLSYILRCKVQGEKEQYTFKQESNSPQKFGTRLSTKIP